MGQPSLEVALVCGYAVVLLVIAVIFDRMGARSAQRCLQPVPWIRCRSSNCNYSFNYCSSSSCNRVSFSKDRSRWQPREQWARCRRLTEMSHDES